MTEILDKLKAVNNLPHGKYALGIYKEVSFLSIMLPEELVLCEDEKGRYTQYVSQLPTTDQLLIINELYKHLR